jgi:CRP-like cAMP-binding protein
MENGKATGVAVTGNEGAIGVASFLGGVSMLSEALVLSAGFAYRLKADVVRDEFGHGGALPRLLLRYTAALMAQIGQTAICNRYHSVEQQFCRSILSCLDRVPLNELTITQHLIADMLGVRREGVTLAAGTLQAAGLIGWSRGRMVVLDRRRLEERVCECYAIDRGVHEHLIDSETAAGNAA